MELTTNTAPQPIAALGEVEQRLGHLMLQHHPFFRRPDAKDPRFLRTMLQLGFEFSEVLGRYLTLLAHRLWDTNKPVVSILVSQVHDELGRGKFQDDGHQNLYRDMVQGLESWSDGAAMEQMREPQKRLIEELTRCLGAENVDQSLGAYVGTEIIASDIIVHISQVMSQLGLAKPAMRWSQCHDVVELEHVQGIYEVPRYLPQDPERLRNFWGSAEEMMRAMWRYFDALNRISFA
jgi:Iron-containing redox enzyme